MIRASKRRSFVYRLAAGSLLMLAAAFARAAAPLLYHQPAYQSPVTAEPDDLVLIAGYGFDADDRVIYQAIDTAPSTHPRTLPAGSDANFGFAEVVNRSNVPYSLTIRLPASLRPSQTYALWVVTAKQEWSDFIRINDARPLWFSPAFAYATAPGGPARELKIVGRNLNPAPGARTEVRLVGQNSVTLKAESASSETLPLDHYVVVAKLPVMLPIGTYRVQVRRDNSSWVEVPGQTLQVRADPAPLAVFDVGEAAYGGCKPNDGLDDTPCILRAVAAAGAAGGGVVSFGPGTWNLGEMTGARSYGILVPRGVTLRGAGKLSTTIVQGPGTDNVPARAWFTLQGENAVQGFTFRDTHVYSPRSGDSAILRLGGEVDAAAAAPAAAVEDILITQNLFERPNVAVSDNGRPLVRIAIIDNEFRAYRLALNLSGSRYLVNTKFNVTDSRIQNNVFKPGSYLAVDIVQGAMASEIGAATRLDFSNNIADGASTEGLNSPSDARGWRAAFFWHLNGNQEMLLVSQNSASCTGDKDGDGEAISFDNNANTFGLAGAASVVGADADSVTISGALAKRQNDRDIKISDYYAGHWIQVGAGPGLGQARKILSYAENSADGTVTFKIAPSWDVIPGKDQTRVNVGREYWQVYAVANEVDHRQPLCQKSNRTSQKGGSISLWAQNADSVIEANHQHDTDGIIFQQYYNAEESSCAACGRSTFYASFLEIRGNIIDGEYDWNNDCSSSGIFGSMAAGPTPHSVPPTVGYGVAISHNVISRADGRQGGAISFQPTWFQGPPPGHWRLVDSTLIFHNTLRGLDAAPARVCQGGSAHPRTGISLGGSLMTDSTLYGNSCIDARRALAGEASDWVAVCPAGTANTCECRAMKPLP